VDVNRFAAIQQKSNCERVHAGVSHQGW
jgi:hypothetical protein